MARISFNGFKDPVTPSPLHHVGGRRGPDHRRRHDSGAGGHLDPLVLRRGLPQGPGRHDHRLRALGALRDQLHGLPHAGRREPGRLPHPQGRGAGRTRADGDRQVRAPAQRRERSRAHDEVEDKCTQCHDLKTRNVTPSPGIKINHQIHAGQGSRPARSATTAPRTSRTSSSRSRTPTVQPSKKHEDFMEMTACFRCHSQDASGVPRDADAEKAPTGACEACHTPEFQLKPPSHETTGFMPGRSRRARQGSRQRGCQGRRQGMVPVRFR